MCMIAGPQQGPRCAAGVGGALHGHPREPIAAVGADGRAEPRLLEVCCAHRAQVLPGGIASAPPLFMRTR
eukprot:276201-Prorocentrum_minimum.AAC.1